MVPHLSPSNLDPNKLISGKLEPSLALAAGSLFNLQRVVEPEEMLPSHHHTVTLGRERWEGVGSERRKRKSEEREMKEGERGGRRGERREEGERGVSVIGVA